VCFIRCRLLTGVLHKVQATDRCASMQATDRCASEGSVKFPPVALNMKRLKNVK